jgi:hypothetical protein
MAPTGAVSVNPTDLTLLFGLMTNQTGALVCGYTGSRDSQAFDISVVTPSGATVKAGTASQTFPYTDPSILNNTLMGTGSIDSMPGQPFSLFMAEFSASGSTVMNMTPGFYYGGVAVGGMSNGSLTQVDEMMIRCTQNSMAITDASGNKGTLVTSPHFVGADGMYCDLNKSLSVNGLTSFAPIGYFMFMPASKIGIGANFFVTGAGVVDPVANGADYDKTGNPTNPATWTLKDPLAWINDPKCAGLLAVANQVVASNPSTNLLAVATYFESYFAKFDAAQSALFDSVTGNLVGDDGLISFSIIALDDLPNGAGTTPVPMPLNNHSTIDLVWDATNTAYALNSGVLDLEGAPPIQFATAVVPAPVIVSFVATNAIPAVPATGNTPAIPAVAATLTPVFTNANRVLIIFVSVARSWRSSRFPLGYGWSHFASFSSGPGMARPAPLEMERGSGGQGRRLGGS